VGRGGFDRREAVGVEELDCGEREGVLFDGEPLMRREGDSGAGPIF
jgi:hypothetical protein